MPNLAKPSSVLAGADPGFGNGGGGARFVAGERFVAKRVIYTSEASDEGSEYKSAGGTGALKAPENLEPLRVNLSVIWQIIS